MSKFPRLIDLRTPAGKQLARELLAGGKRRGRPGRRFDWADRLTCQVAASGLPAPTREVVFHPTRKWRFDLAWIDRLIFVECDGGGWIAGRRSHGSEEQMRRDCTKWNTATAAGWTGFRFTGTQVRDGSACGFLRSVLG